MKKITRKQLFISIGVCLIISTIPFFTKEQSETFNSTLASSFTILGTLISITTLIIALILFDRFGIDSKFKEKQVDAVLELVDKIKTTYLSVDARRFTYTNYIRFCALMETFPKETYAIDKSKVLLFPDTFEQDLIYFTQCRKNPWFPNELKPKLEFLNIRMAIHVEASDTSEYVKLNINNKTHNEHLKTFPKLTFEMFSINMTALLASISKWLNEHSNIKIDFDIQN